MDKKNSQIPLPKFLDRLFKGKKSGGIIIIIGVIGIALIFLSNLLPSGNGKSAPPANTSSDTTDAYLEEMERKLSGMVESISGSPTSQVVITLDSGYEYVYANDKKQKNDTTEESEKTKQTDDIEQNYVIVKDENGSEIALKVTEYTPRVKGVVIVCERGNDDDVARRITNAVTVALGIPSTSVYVTGLS